MGVIMHENVSYGGGSLVEANPSETSTGNLTKLGIDGTVYDVSDADAVHSTDVGSANGVAELDSNGKVPASQLPSYVDDVIEAYYDSVSDRFYEESTFTTVIPPESGKTWVDIPANKSYRWTGSVYVRTDEGVQLGETSDTAYRGDRGKIAYDHSQSDHSGIKPAFTEASTRANIASGESFATILGKIKKFFSDLKTVAFTGAYSDLSGTPTIPTVNNGTLTIKQNNNNLGTFNANQSTASNINIECAVPSDVEGSKVATGNPLTVTDAAGIKAEKIEIGFEPKQDKHGYNSVWVGGAGKNKLPSTLADIKAINTTGTWSGNVYSLNNATFTVNTDADGNITGYVINSSRTSDQCRFLLCHNVNINVTDKVFISNGFPSSGLSNTTKFFNIEYTFKNSSSSNSNIYENEYASNYISDNIATITSASIYIRSAQTVNNELWKPMIRLDGQSATYEPPSNISQLTGYTSLSANRCGKNLWDGTDSYTNGFLQEDGSISEPFAHWRVTKYIKVIGGNNYTLSFSGSLTLNSSYICFYDENYNFISSFNWTTSKARTVLAPNNAKYVRASYYDTITDLQVEESSSATTYEPYNGRNVTVQFDQTLYGGKLTILQDGSADIDVDTGFDVYDGSSDESWTRVQQTSASAFLISGYASNAISYTDRTQKPDIQSNYLSALEQSATWGSNNGFITTNIDLTDGLFYVGIQSITTVEAWRTYLASNNLQVAYKLKNPFTLHLSPVETLNLLQGINNVWTDGTTLSLTYQPDNAIGQAKGTAQEAMDIANGLKPLYSTGSVGSGKTGSHVIAQITLPEAGIYYITGWARFTGNGKKAVWLWCEGSLSESWEDSTISTAEPKTFSTFAIYTASAAGKVVQVDSYTVSASNAVTGGLVAFKIA